MIKDVLLQGLWIFGGLWVLAWLAQKSFVNINATDKAILLRWGKRTKTILDEGYHFIIPLVHTTMPVHCMRDTKTVGVNEVFTPADKAEIVVTFEATYQPSDLVTYVETKDPEKQLFGMIAEAVRGFAADLNTPPQTWDEAVAMNEKFSRMVIARLMGFDIPRYDDGSSKGQHKSEVDMTPVELENKRLTLEAVTHLRTGDGNLDIPGLGIRINRFNITKVEPSEALSNSLEKISAEEQEQRSESIEARTIAKLVIEWLVEMGYPEEEMRNPTKRKAALKREGMTVAELMRVLRVERGKETADMKQVRLDLPDGVEKIIGGVGKVFGGK